MAELSDVGGHGRHEGEKKVVLLRELCRAITYTTRIIEHVTKSHVRDTVHSVSGEPWCQADKNE
jgi:hypothetical protein